MKRIIGILLAGILCLGLIAGCGEKMSEEEKAYKEACKTFTYEEMMKLDNALLTHVVVTCEISEHGVDASGRPYAFAKLDDGKDIEICHDDIDQYKVGQKITAWGANIGINNKPGSTETFPSIRAQYIDKAK